MLSLPKDISAVKRTIKSFISLILIIACVSAFCLNAVAASNSKTYNDGARHVTCTALSDAGKGYYLNNTYEQLSKKNLGTASLVAETAYEGNS